MRTKELYYPWDKSDTDVLTVDQMDRSNRELEQLYLEAQEYDFLMDKTPKALPEYWEQED